MPRVNIWLNKEIYEKAKEKQLNFSELLRNAIKKKLEETGISFQNNNSELLLRVRCPRCGFEQNTTTIKTVRCMNCNHSYQVYVKGKTSRIVQLLKGDLSLLHKKYYETYGK